MQLAFDLKLHSEATFENFVAGSNAVVVDVLKKMAVGSADHLHAFIWSPSGEGVSHLLQAVCHAGLQHQQQAMYLPLAECKAFGVSLLNGLEDISIICLDDIDVIAGDALWEEALFHAFNRIREKEGRLIIGAHHAVSDLQFRLPDLISRLNWGASYKLLPLNDAEKIALLQLSAQRRGFSLSLDVTKYLLMHYPRDLRTQLALLDRLDKLSLQEKHKITIPFIKSQLTMV